MFLPLRAETPQLRFPFATLGLVAASVAVFLYELTLPQWALVRFARAAGVVPWEISHFTDLVNATHPPDLVPPPLTILTSMFIHGDVLHLAGNLWFLWLFGSRLEGFVGPARLLAGYFLAGTVAALLQVWALPDNQMPMIGASGAIAGVLGAYALVFPRQEVRCLVFVIFFVTFVSLPSSLLLGLWFVGQFISAGGKSPGVAWFAHIGGFLVGMGLARLAIVPPLRLRFTRPRVYGAAHAEAGGRSVGAGPEWANAPLPTA